MEQNISDLRHESETKNKRVQSNVRAVKISKLRSRASQYIAALAASILMFSAGNFNGFTTVVLSELESEKSEITVSLSELTWFSSQLFMQPIGSILIGLAAQQIGSRLIMMLASIMFSISWFIFYYAKNSAMLLIAQGIVSLCTIAGPCVTYVAEISQPDSRSVLMAATNFAFVLGSLFSVTLATFLYWRTITLVNFVFVVIGLTAIVIVPSSPFSLAHRRKFSEAEKSLAWLRGWSPLENVSSEFQIMKDSVLSRYENTTGFSNNRFQDKIKPYFHRSFCIPLASVCFIFIIRALLGSDTLQKFAQVIFKKTHTPYAKYLTVALYIMDILGSLVYIPIVKLTGKRGLMSITLAAAGSMYLTIAISMILISKGAWSAEDYHWIPAISILFSVLLTTAGIDSIGFMYNAELFPSKFRNAGAGIGMFANTISLAIMNKAFIYMVQWITMPGVFVFFFLISMIGLVIFYIILPETEGKTLIEIEDYYDNAKIKNSYEI